MKTNRAVLKATVAALLTLAAGLASAVGTANVEVKATMKEICVLNTDVVVDLGELDPSNAVDIAQDFTVSYKCTNGITPTFVVAGATAMTGSISGSIAFTFQGFVATPGGGFTAPVTAASKVLVPGANYKDAPAGSYSGTATVTISN